MRTLKRLVLVYASGPLNLFLAWPMVLAVRLLWGEGLRWERWILSTEFKRGSWALGGKLGEDGYLEKKRSPKWAGGFLSWLWPRGFYIVNRAAALEGRERPRTWGGTSVGDGQIFGPGRRSPKGTPLEQVTGVQFHETHHTAQSRAAQLAACFGSHVGAFAFALAGPWELAIVFGLLWWTYGGNVLKAAGGWLAAVLEEDPRGFYKGSVHEVGAYAVEAEHRARLAAARRRVAQ